MTPGNHHQETLHKRWWEEMTSWRWLNGNDSLELILVWSRDRSCMCIAACYTYITKASCRVGVCMTFGGTTPRAAQHWINTPNYNLTDRGVRFPHVSEASSRITVLLQSIGCTATHSTLCYPLPPPTSQLFHLCVASLWSPPCRYHCYGFLLCTNSLFSKLLP